MAEDCHGYTRGSVAEPACHGVVIRRRVLWLRCWSDGRGLPWLHVWKCSRASMPRRSHTKTGPLAPLRQRLAILA